MVVRILPYEKLIKSVRDRYGSVVEIKDLKQSAGQILHVQDDEFYRTARELESFGYLRRFRGKIQLTDESRNINLLD